MSGSGRGPVKTLSSPRLSRATAARPSWSAIVDDVEMDKPAMLRDAVIKDWAEQYELCAVWKQEMFEREVAGRRRRGSYCLALFRFTADTCGFTTDDGPSECRLLVRRGRLGLRTGEHGLD